MKLSATHFGDLHFSNDFALLDILFVPSFEYNLLSVTKMSATLSCEVVFSAKSCLIQDLATKKKIDSTSVNDGHYYLDTKNFAINNECFAVNKNFFLFFLQNVIRKNCGIRD